MLFYNSTSKDSRQNYLSFRNSLIKNTKYFCI